MVKNIAPSSISLAILMIAEMNNDGIASVDDIRHRIPILFELSEHDKQIYNPDTGEYMWERRIRYIISNPDNKGNILHEGYAKYSNGEFKITDKGREFLKKKGMKPVKAEYKG